ncbi:1-hydroxy-2-methyl-2-(E)-butenyl 4-diphosphate synthase [Halobacteroides halobius DSM 5150]|uniref:4-hydroxy-3-methylbut-2-en-1-yl diphosphate synthase (flavodoxin) n=1 Tax=Halobacteroides halobius (strain ATCC 35273 / DSM 5150 / MD-1) TaxID=748449 RepID=L0K8H3_HALHC|nr:flavodoxin-dependent (E)-4-hydroxy-3-methylbut-2-enyl-diphosphate synthase [Halobacteroides halobius]AGB40669.1 1-hydroxy-2-methyl-2-(E)-butenyl 4-diphosphate synthase [Halobacteroides halobius DSM 5150]
MRRKTKAVEIGDVQIGGNAPVSIQSMTNTDTRNVEKTVAQIKELEKVGCELIRVAIPDQEAATKVDQIRESINIPLIADIHFDYKLALEVLKRGIDGLRINPGNIGGEDKVRQVALEATKRKVPIRVGVNAGSLGRDVLKKYGYPTAEAMVESALENIKVLEKFDFTDIIISLKASDVLMTLKAYQLMAQEVDYPFHVGITEAGTVKSGTIKSAVGIGSILSQGLGDTIRVSLTGDPREEIKVGYEILKSLKLRDKGPTLVSCPTCGRCEIDLVQIANKVEQEVAKLDQPIEIAVMGCAVNGPGEAREADIGIAGGKNEGLIFKEGEILRKVPADKLVDELMNEVEKL